MRTVMALVVSTLLAMLAVAGPALAATKDVSIAGFAFSPADLTIANGVSVTWTNADGVAHTVTADDGSFDSGTIGSGGGTFSHTFGAAGSFAYHCEIHRSMTGTIVVQSATSPPTSTVAPADPASPPPAAPLVALAAAALGLFFLRMRLLRG